jgi:hypothetical protein
MDAADLNHLGVLTANHGYHEPDGRPRPGTRSEHSSSRPKSVSGANTLVENLAR